MVKVTNLDDSGPGSLRWALTQVEGPRTVVFEVNGTITLKEQIIIEDPNVTIAGQTALGDGITIAGSRIRVKADEVIIRGLKFRPGDGEVGMDAGDRDGLFIGTTDFQIDNVIVDHNSFTWGVDENVSINGWVKNITLSNNIIAEGLSQSIHPKGEHSKGLLISNWSSTQGDYNSNITVTKNLFASNTERNPNIHAGQGIEVVNNYIYNYGMKHAAIYVGGGTGGSLVTTAELIGNVIQAGPNTPGLSAPIGLATMAAGSAVQVTDNIGVLNGASTAVTQAQSTLTWNSGGLQHATSQSAFENSNVTVLATKDVKDYVLANAGAAPGDRDAIDARIVTNVAAGTETRVNSVAEAGGYTANPLVKAAADTDNDGMPNWFEDIYGLGSTVGNANGDNDGDGYTNIEEYINGLISGFNLGIGGLTVKAVTAQAGAADLIDGTGLNGKYLVVNGFNAAQGDRIQLSGMVPQLDAAHRLTDYVEAVTVGNTTYVSVDADGTGAGSAMRIVAELRGVNSVQSVADLVSVTTPAAVEETPSPETPVITAPIAAGNDRFVIGKTASTITAGELLANDQGGSGALRIASVSGALGGTASLTAGGAVIFTPSANFSGRAGFDYIAADSFGNQNAGHADVIVYCDVAGTAGVDKLVFNGEWVNLSAGAGNDQVRAGVGDDILDGGAGNDSLSGGAGNDTIIGGIGVDNLNGEDGDDTIDGGADNDTIRAGAGNDIIHGGDGNDNIMGEGGDDTVHGGPGNDSVSPGPGNDWVDAGAGNDKVAAGIGNDIVHGGTGDDSLLGEGDDDQLHGDAGNDKLDGGIGNDRLFGGDGIDILTGGLGDDWLQGGAGNDRLVGSAGADTFVIEGPAQGYDTIVDFVRTEDRIAIDGAAFGMTSLDNLIIGNGAKALTADATLLYDTKTGILSFDADGTGAGAATKLALFANRAALDEENFSLL